ncbi:universal stress protein [Granulicella sp. L60]|uniref:universal stress protein n=1 Tax=Granulicella sp. L60 TaxID=1641866 RepID=UPI00131D7658|nr:universal stress protein [Granulicella sp. L60]
MKSIRRILFPVDFGARCIAAADQVTIWANQFMAEVVTLYVVDPRDFSNDPDRYADDFFEARPNLEKRAQDDLEFFCNQYLKNLTVWRIVSSGDTASQISSYAESEKTDLVMLPRDHQNIGSRFIGDSITGKVLETCSIAVWTSEHVKSQRAEVPKQILCALHIGDELSLDAENERLLETVNSVASCFGAEVTCLYIGDGNATSLPAIANRLAGVRHKIQAIGSLETTSGSVGSGIQKSASEHQADLIMVGRSRPGTLSYGAQASVLKIDHRAECPVLSIF